MPPIGSYACACVYLCARARARPFVPRRPTRSVQEGISVVGADKNDLNVGARKAAFWLPNIHFGLALVFAEDPL